MKLSCLLGDHKKVYLKTKEVLYDESLKFAVDYIFAYWKCNECKKIESNVITGGVSFTAEELNKEV